MVSAKFLPFAAVMTAPMLSSD